MTQTQFTPLASKTRRAIVLDLRTSDDPYRAIARRHGVHHSTVSRVAIQSGIYRRPKGKTAADLIRSGTITVGRGQTTLSGWVLALPDDAINWLHSETPDGATISEIIRAIVIDAYHDSEAGKP